MLKVEALIKYLSENNPQETVVRFAFFNYLNNLTTPETLVTAELVESFFSICLDYAHWQQNREQLGNEIMELLGDHLDPSEVKWPQQVQVIELENLTDATDALQGYLNSIYKKGEKYRLILEGEKKILAIVLNADQSISVRSFDRKMVIRHGQLEPLKKDLILHYTSNLELDPDQVQRLEIGPFVIAQFTANESGVIGGLVRGYQHQKFFDLNGADLGTYPKLFYSIKRIEQYFLQRQSDPFYQENVSALEKTIEKMRLYELDDVQEAMDVMARAQNVLEYVFTGDKLLTLLIRDLQHTLAQRNSRVVRTPQKVEEPWNKSTSPARPTTPAMKQAPKTQTQPQAPIFQNRNLPEFLEIDSDQFQEIPLQRKSMEASKTAPTTTPSKSPQNQPSRAENSILRSLRRSDLTN